MSSDKDRHDYSLLGSFMPKDVADPRRTIPVEINFGDDDEAKAAPGAPEKKRSEEPRQD